MSSSPIPPPVPPQMPPKKTSPLVWILVGVVGFVFLVGMAIAVIGYVFVSKVKEVAGSPAGVARMVAKMNPDLDVISTDDSTGKITIKDKRTGKVVTLNFDDVKNGRISFQEEGKGAVTIDAKGAEGTVDITSPDGKMHLGAGSAKVPAWVPAYPGAASKGTFSTTNDRQEAGQFTFTTRDAADKVAQYFQDELKKNGYTVSTMSAGATIVSGHIDGEKRTVGITVTSGGDETTGTVTYAEKR